MTDLPVDDAQPKVLTAGQTVRVTSGSRLHFGLLDTVVPFGGVGVMIDIPRTQVVVSESDHFYCDDQEAPRLQAIAERIARRAKLSHLPRCRITVSERAPAHCGLGSGTQLAMATAEAVCRFVGLRPAAEALATSIAARGKRSAVGVHGYFSGGLIFEDAEQVAQMNPLQQRVELPSDWCVGVFRPTRDTKTVSGSFEREQFARLPQATAAAGAKLRDIVLRQMLPAARAGQLDDFAASVQQYNEASGRLFAAVQGGPYNGTAVTRLIDRLVEHRARGVGQSSWGPGVFAWFDSMTSATNVANQLPDDVALIAIARPLNAPREIAAGRSVNRSY